MTPGPGSAAAHPLFRQFPLDGLARLSTGTAPTPYRVHDGQGLFIGGTADLPAVRALLAPEQVSAVETVEGRALMGVWLFDFSAASLGAHHELQVSLFVSRQALAPVPAHRLQLLDLMLNRPEVLMLCHGLWNTTPTVVAYNRELLALDARLSDSRITHAGPATDFAVRDRSTGATVIEGRVARMSRMARPSLLANLSLMRLLGLRRLGALARQPWLSMPVLNPVGERMNRNAAAQTHTRADVSLLRYADARHDRLAWGDTRYRALGFRADFVQSMAGFKFVYLAPDGPAPTAARP